MPPSRSGNGSARKTTFKKQRAGMPQLKGLGMPALATSPYSSIP